MVPPGSLITTTRWLYISYKAFLQRGETPSKDQVTLMKITSSHSAYQRTKLNRFKAPIHKTKFWHSFARSKIMDGCLFFSFFPRVVVLNQLSTLRKSGEGSFDQDSKILLPFLNNEKYRKAASTLPCQFFSKYSDQNYYIVVLFTKVEKSNNYVFEDDLTPHSPQEKGWKLCLVFLYSISY